MATTTIRADTTERHVNKYTNRNPIHRLSLERFYDCVAAAVRRDPPESVLDFGCGEGFILDQLAERGLELPNYTGLDLRRDALSEAARRHPGAQFECANLFDPAYDKRQFHTVMALEVLEHLYDPDRALKRLSHLATHRLVLTVPNEPWFQLANLARGRDVIRLGNHPEHVQHWNRRSFTEFVGQYGEVQSVETRFPFIIITARPK